MKAQTKALIASVMVIALALTAVSGVTYSWFSDEDEATIVVSTAAVDYEATYIAEKISGDSSITVEESAITIKNLAANAKFKVTPELTNKSTIDTIYRIYATYDKGGFDNNDLNNIMINGTALSGKTEIPIQVWTPAGTPANAESESVASALPFTISTTEEYRVAGAAHTGLKITIHVEAYQGSYAAPADPSEGTVEIPASGAVTGQISVEGGAESETAQIFVVFPEEAKGNEFKTGIAKSSDGSYTISATLNGAGATFASPVTMTVTLSGDLTGSNVVYLGTDGSQPEVVSAVYDGSANTTTITFTTTHFSDFAVVAGNIVAIADLDDGAVGTYTTLADAIKATTGTVVLVKDIACDVVIPAGKTVTLDLNGKKLINVSDHTIVNNGTLTVIGKGTVDNISHGKAPIFNKVGATATLEGGEYIRSFENGKTTANSGGNSYYVIKNLGTMTIKDGVTVSFDGHFSSLVANGFFNSDEKEANSGDGAPTLTINGGKFTGGINTIKNDDYGVLVINGGTFMNVTQFALQNHHIATINGGVFESGDKATKAVIGDCRCDAGMDMGTLTINGGEFHPADGKVVLDPYGYSLKDGSKAVIKAKSDLTGITVPSEYVWESSDDGYSILKKSEA